MPTKRRPIRRVSSFHLTTQQRFELIFGSLGPHGSAFPDEQAKRGAWEAHRDTIELNPGFRPDAWWEYDAPLALRQKREALGHGSDGRLLWEANLLRPEERVALAGWWRRSEQRAFEYATWVAGHSGIKAACYSYEETASRMPASFRRKLTETRGQLSQISNQVGKGERDQTARSEEIEIDG